VRELRNYVERCYALGEALPLGELTHSREPREVDATLSYEEARRVAVQEFERAYVDALVKLHQGNISRAARAADMNRVYLYRLMHKHGIRGGGT
jgi:DNA-binding NtrC family response regulator